MVNASVNLEKDKAFRGGKDYRSEILSWLSRQTATLWPTEHLQRAFPTHRIMSRSGKILFKLPCQGHSQLEVKSLKQAKVFDIL